MLPSARMRFFEAVAVALVLTACAAPRTPSSDDESDAGLTCDERLRARGLCLEAGRARCQSQLTDCESTCETRGDLPANTRKEPSLRDDLETTQCRDRCRVALDPCVRSIQIQCPVPCQ